MYPYRDYFKANVYYYLGTWTLRGAYDHEKAQGPTRKLGIQTSDC